MKNYLKITSYGNVVLPYEKIFGSYNAARAPREAERMFEMFVVWLTSTNDEQAPISEAADAANMEQCFRRQMKSIRTQVSHSIRQLLLHEFWSAVLRASRTIQRIMSELRSPSMRVVLSGNG